MPDLQSYYNTPELTGAAREAETAGTTAVNYQSAAGLLPQKLREAVMAKVDYNKDIIEQQNKAQAEYFAAPSAARAEYVDPESSNYIFNPFQAEALVAQKRSLAYQPFANLTDILGQRLGTLGDIIQNGVGAFQADVAAKQGAYEIARNKYNDLLQKANALMQAAAEEERLKLNREEFDFSKEQALKKIGGGSGGTDIPGVTKANQKTAEKWEDLLYDSDGNMRNEYDIWKEINANQTAYALQGIDVNKLWQMHASYANSNKTPQTSSVKEEGVGSWLGRILGFNTPPPASTKDLSGQDFGSVDLSALNR